MEEELQRTDSMNLNQKAKVSNSLVHRIRVIQGHTNINYTEPHFIQSKECVRQTKDFINSIKADLRKGCSDVLRSARDKTRFSSDINSSLMGNEISIKKRQLKSLMGEPDKSGEREEVKLEAKKTKNNLYNVSNALYEGGERPDIVSSARLSQTVGKESAKGMQIVSNIVAEGKTAKKKKRRKRKRDEIEITSSMTIAQSKVNVCNFIQGDSRPLRVNPRKNRERYSCQRRPECSGDESDIEDNGSGQITDMSEARSKYPRRRLRPKHGERRTSSLTLTQNERDIRAMVSSTIDKLNNVNDHVKKVIEDSLSSEPSYVLENSGSASARRTVAGDASRTFGGDASATSANWSSSAMSKATLVDVSEISKSVSLQTPASEKKHSQTQATIVGAPVDKEKTTSQTPRAPPSAAQSVAVDTATAEEANSARHKRKKQKNDEAKVEKETVDVVSAKEAPKKKKSNVNKPATPAEPVSSMKKSGKKKKDKKKEHVNFVTTPPEVVPDYHPVAPAPPIAPKKTDVKTIIPTIPDDKQKQQKNPPKPNSQENTIAAAPVKRTNKPTRRVSSAKTYRQTSKRELPKVRSTGNLDPTHREAPLTVRSVLEEEANNERKRSSSKGRNRSGSREGHRDRSKSGGRDENRSRSKSRGRRDETLRSRDIREIYYKIRTNTTNTIANINQQMSSTLKESIAHLNDICGKVRNTLTDMEKDEQTYKRLKSKQSFEVSSEGGGSTISVQTNKAAKEDAQGKSGDKTTVKSHTYTVITQPCQDTSIGQLMSTLSMGGDNLVVEKSHVEVPATPSSREKKKRRSRESKKRPSSKQQIGRPKTITPTISSSKNKFGTVKTISTDKTSLAKIPIWQRKPPSVIEEIQLTVKKQATKSQYREFLRALKSIARKQRSQVHVVPQEFREIMEKQQEKAFDAISKHKLVQKKKKDAKPTVEVNNVCKNCPPDKCTCGVTVENSITPSNLQRSNWLHVRTDPARKGIQVYDILDEITLKDVEPIRSEYPRKDHVSDADANKRVEDTLLYKLLYSEDPKVLESLLKSSCPPVEEHKQVSKLSTAKTQERPKSVSDAYRLYEQLEFNAEKTPSLNLTPTKGSICLKSSDNSKAKDKPKAVDTCTKDFDDELVIPDDLKPTMKTQVVNSPKKSCRKKYCHIKLKSDDETASLRSRKRIEDKMKVLSKTSSVRSISRRSWRSRFSKENIKSRMKNYNVDSKYKIKKILTVMPISIVQNKSRLKKGKLVDVEKSEAQRDLKISDENMAKINNMTKREIIQILKPYIFFDLQPPVVTVMPVYPKYNHQNKHQKQEHNNYLNKGPTFKKIIGYLKDHDDDCHSGKKLCRRCQMLMQSGDETSKKNETTGAKKFEPLSQKQLWKNKYKPTPSENLVSRILGKNASRKKFQAAPPDDKANSKEVIVTMTPRELNRNAANTRSKLNEVRNLMESHKPLLGQHLDDIIDALEFKIVDALSNPKNQHTEAFNEIESEIQSILSTIGELKEINQEHIRENNTELKSKTNVDLEEDSSDPSEMKSKTDIDLYTSISKIMEDAPSPLTNKEEIITPILEETPDVIIEEDERTTENEIDEKKIDQTYSNLGKDIQKVIQGLDAIMSIDEEAESKKGEEIVVKTDNVLPESEDAMATFCEQMDEVMRNVGSPDDLNISTDTLDAFTTEDVQEKRSDEYLTPFMRAVKNYRRNEQSQNFLDFLDKLTMLSKEAISLTIYPRMPMQQATIKRSAHIIEVAQTYNQAIQCEEIITDGPAEMEENFYEANASVCAHPNTEEAAPKRDEVLSTNQWMQTEEIKLEGELEEVKDCLVQTSSTVVQFHEVEEYLDSLDGGIASPNIIPPTEKNTQVPSGPNHICFAKNSSKDVQVTADLLEMTSTTVGNQTGGSSDGELMKTTTSAECQVDGDFVESLGNNSSRPAGVDENVVDYSTAGKEVDPVATVDMASMEKYTNRIDNCFGGNVSDFSFNECARTAYTDSYITRGKNSLLGSDLRLYDKSNSYPTTKKSSNIISLFESHKSSDDTNYTRDFLEDGFGKSPADSYESMLARCASSEIDSSAPTTITVEKLSPHVISPKSKVKRNNSIAVKIVRQKNEENYRHKHILHSVYGIVFVLMFLSINLNYTCYN